MNVKIAFSVLLISVAALPAGAGENQPITMRVSPAIAFAPANLTVRATVQADDLNRTIEVEAESDSFYRSSEIQLEGQRAPRTSLFEFRSLPPGSYEVRATVRGTRGEKRSMIRQQVDVMASGSAH